MPAKRLLRAETRTHFSGEAHSVRQSAERDKPGSDAVTAVSPLCAGFGAGVGQGPLKRDFGGVGPRVGKWFLGGSVTENLPSQSSMNSREKRPPGARFWVLRRRSILVLG